MRDHHSELLDAGFKRNDPPPVLLPYQQRWTADDSPLKVAEKSRRIGLTWAEASDNVLTAAASNGTNVFYIGPTQDMALEYIEACAMWARAFDYAASEIEDGLFEDIDSNGDTRHIKMFAIRFPGSRHRIVALSSRPTNLRGKQGVIVIDEAAFHNDLAELIKAALAMLLWGDKVHILSTHDGQDNKFNDLIGEIRAGKRKGTVHRITFMQAVDEGLYTRVCMRRGLEWSQEAQDKWVEDAYGFYGEDADEELDVVPAQGSGAYLSLALIESRMTRDVPIIRQAWSREFNLTPEPLRRKEVADWLDAQLLPHLQRLDKTLAHGIGGDFGRSGDQSVYTPLAEYSDLTLRPPFMVEVANMPFKQQEQLIEYVVDRLPRFRSGAFDAGGNGASVAEHAADKYGATVIDQVKLSEKFYLEHMPKFKAGFEDGTLDGIPRDSEIRDDLRTIRLINGIPKLPKLRAQKGEGRGKRQRHGDAAISLFLGHYAMRRAVVPMEFVAVGRPRESGGFTDYFGRFQ